MNAEKKVRADAVLKNLPEERQLEIFELLKEKSLAAARQHLREDGIRVSLQTLSEFYSWYALRMSLREAESDTENLLELIKQDAPELPEERLAAIGNALFNLRAIKSQDPKMFLAFQTARHNAEMDRLKFEQKEREIAQREKGLQLEREKFEFDAAKACLEKLPELKVIAASDVDENTKIEQIRLRLFGQLPEKTD
jgi:hypothetical protein